MCAPDELINAAKKLSDAVSALTINEDITKACDAFKQVLKKFEDEKANVPCITTVEMFQKATHAIQTEFVDDKDGINRIIDLVVGNSNDEPFYAMCYKSFYNGNDNPPFFTNFTLSEKAFNRTLDIFAAFLENPEDFVMTEELRQSILAQIKPLQP